MHDDVADLGESLPKAGLQAIAEVVRLAQRERRVEPDREIDESRVGEPASAYLPCGSDLMKLVRDTLQAKGYRTIDAGTGEEGVQLAREQQPALVLMDIQLPGISGVEAFHQLRADPSTSSIPVIAVTASVMAQERQKVMAAGFDGFQELVARGETVRTAPIGSVDWVEVDDDADLARAREIAWRY